jgi:hypothetical protein
VGGGLLVSLIARRRTCISVKFVQEFVYSVFCVLCTRCFVFCVPGVLCFVYPVFCVLCNR